MSPEAQEGRSREALAGCPGEGQRAPVLSGGEKGHGSGLLWVSRGHCEPSGEIETRKRRVWKLLL